jgi:hypothetical protein
MHKEWSSKGYPAEYIGGFDRFRLSNHQAVARVYNYIEATAHQNDPPITGIGIETDSRGTIVYIGRSAVGPLKQTGIMQVNWADPYKNPGDYLVSDNSRRLSVPSYASTFWRFYGPDHIQSARATLLAQRFGVEVEDYSKYQVLLEIPSLGWAEINTSETPRRSLLEERLSAIG